MPTLLASKDAALFRSVVKCYEQKQYKKGLKACDVSYQLIPPPVYKKSDALTVTRSKSYERTRSTEKR